MNAMATLSHILFVLLLLIHGAIQKSDPASLTYRAGVVELRPMEYRNNSAETLNENSEKIIRYIKQAAEREVDIVVFPELALPSISLGKREDLVVRSMLIPHPSQNYAPCNDSRIPIHEALKKIACAVEQNSIYVVINLFEKEICSGNACPDDGLFVYISNVVFDRNGRIIARSRKSHLSDEYEIVDVLEKPEPSIFHTDFGVTFGSVACADSLYEDLWPEFNSLNITDIVLTSGSFTHMPFLTAIQVYSGLAYVRDINLLSSGYNRIEWGFSGSGIYAGRGGIVTAVQPLEDRNELLVADIRKKNTPATQTDRHGSRLSNVDQKEHDHDQLRGNYDAERFRWLYIPFNDFESKLISDNGLTVERLSHGEVECRFRVNFTNSSPASDGLTYRLLALDGVVPIGTTQSVLGARICAIVLCANNTITSCARALTSSGTFNSIEIEAVHVDNSRTSMMPNTLRTNMLPFMEWTWDQHRREDNIHTFMALTTPTENVITFGIFGRNYRRDGRIATSN